MDEEKAKEYLICDHVLLCSLFAEIEGQLLLWHSASATGGTYLKAIVSTCKKINTLTNTPTPPSSSPSSSPSSLDDIPSLCKKIDALSIIPFPSNSSPSSSFSLNTSPLAIQGDNRESIWGVLANKGGIDTSSLPSKMLNEQLRAYDALMSSLLSKYDILELVSKKIYEIGEKCQCVLRALVPSPSFSSTSLFAESFPPQLPNPASSSSSSSSSFSLSSSSLSPLPPPHHIPSFALHSSQWLCLSPKNKRINRRKRPTSFSSPSVAGGGKGGGGRGRRGGEVEEEEEEERFILLPALKEYSDLLEETLEYIRTHSLQKLLVKESLSYFMENKTVEQHLGAWMESEKEWETFEKRFSDITELIEEEE